MGFGALGCFLVGSLSVLVGVKKLVGPGAVRCLPALFGVIVRLRNIGGGTILKLVFSPFVSLDVACMGSLWI